MLPILRCTEQISTGSSREERARAGRILKGTPEGKGSVTLFPVTVSNVYTCVRTHRIIQLYDTNHTFSTVH